MRKILSLISVIVLTFSMFTVPALAMGNTSSDKVSFQIDDVMDYAQVYGVRNDSATVKIPVILDMNNNMSADLVVTVNSGLSRASGVKNISVKGSFYRTSDGTIVTLYGVSGSVEYTSDSTKITGTSSYHTSALSGWSGTHSLSEEYYPTESHVRVIQGNFSCYNGNSLSSTGQVRIAVSQNGYVSVGGDYISYTVN